LAVVAGWGLLGLAGVARPRFVLVALAFAVGLGYGWARLPEAPPASPQFVEDREYVYVTGRVESVVAKEDRRLRLILDEVSCRVRGEASHLLPGKLAWTWADPPPVAERPLPGQRVTFGASVRPARGFANHGTWDYAFYWARRGVFHTCWTRGADKRVDVGPPPTRPLHALRTTIIERLETVPDTQGRAVLMALLAGERFHIEHTTRDLWSRASIAHTLALSGLHVGIVALVGFMLAHVMGLVRPDVYLRLPRPKLAVFLAAPLVCGFVWLGGAGESLVRAAVMFGCFGYCLLRDRERALWDGLAMAAAVLLVWNPLSVFSLGFQLSFLAVASIGVGLPMFGRLIDRSRLTGRGVGKRIVRGALYTLATSLSVNIGLAFVVLTQFGELTPHFALNVLWLPLLSFVVLPLGFVGLVLALVPGLSGAGVAILGADAALIQGVIDLLSWLDEAGWLRVIVGMRPTWPAVVGYFVFLFGLLLARRPGPRGWWPLALGVALIAAPPIWEEHAHRGQVRLSVLDVGDGQGLIIEGPRGSRWLIDGGGTNGPRFDIGRAIISPVLTRSRAPRLDGVILSHPDTDHGRGLIYALRHFEVGRFISTGHWPDKTYITTLRETVETSGVAVETRHAPDVLELEEDLILEILHPRPSFEAAGTNNASLVLRLVWRGRGLALLPGDVEQTGLRALLETRREMEADVLVLPHHGLASSRSDALYARVDPCIAVASIGSLKFSGFPCQAIEEELTGRGCDVLTTSRYGMIRVLWDEPDAAPELRTHYR
jgi:competence protein ComEC